MNGLLECVHSEIVIGHRGKYRNNLKNVNVVTQDGTQMYIPKQNII